MGEQDFAEETAGARTAIVPVSARGETSAAHFRPSASIIAQLLATKLDAPQTRARRRAGDAEGIAAYGAAREKIRLGRRAAGASVFA